MLLGYTVVRVCASASDLACFTRLFFLMRGWGLGTQLLKCSNTLEVGKAIEATIGDLWETVEHFLVIPSLVPRPPPFFVLWFAFSIFGYLELR